MPTTNEQRKKYCRDLQDDLERTKKFILNSTILKHIFDVGFFEYVHQQIEGLNENPFGLVHPLWNLVLVNEPKSNFMKLRLLSEYLNLIFGHLTIKKTDTTYIKRELVSNSEINSLNTLFEVSILGLLLKHLDRNKIILYPKTVDKKNVEVSMVLVDRLVYLETTVLGESKKDKEERIKLTNAGIKSWGGSRNVNQDIGRFVSKLKDKADQMIKRKPNVLLLGKYDFYPVRFQMECALQEDKFPRIGILMQFDRTNLVTVFKNGLDPDCSISKKEESILEDLFRSKYQPLIYG